MSGPRRAPDESRDRDEVVAVVKEETFAWIRRDPEAWADCWVRDERARHVNARPSVGARRLVGFDAIWEFFGNAIIQSPQSGVRPDQVLFEDWQVSVDENMAWVAYDQVIPLGAPTDSAPGRHHEMRILERTSAGWKIVVVVNLPYRIGYYEVPWVRVDEHGVILQFGPAAEEALVSHRTLQLVGNRLVARQRSDTSKLKETLAEAANLIQRRQGRSPIPLVLSDAADDLISLSWVSIADMMIVVLLGDEKLLERSIAQGGETYGLTAAQIRVAEAIARGNDLNRVAKTLSVKPNTVRTHVRRMFEKVGVSSQAALVRALLSSEAPKP